ncbi:hypothetical protein [Georgenia sp. Z1491]|uniref:hypothetical protein n=1 Tax=Georgenia sp. Z1491 TaxID=3416707 RepID=UPI003CEBA63F
MSNEGRWRHEGNAFEQPGADATRPVHAGDAPRADGPGAYGPVSGSQGSAGHGTSAYGSDHGRGAQGASAYGSDRTGGAQGASAYRGSEYTAGGAGAAPTYQPSYGGGSGGDLPPGDGGRTPRGGGFPWLAVILGVLAVAAAAVAVWFFLLRDSGNEEAATDDADVEVPSGESGSDSAPPTDEDPSGDETPSDDPTEEGTGPGDESDTDSQDESETDDGSEDDTGGAESPSDDDADGPGTPDDATLLEIGETHTLENGMEVTLDAVERDAECATSPGDPFTALTFTVVAHDDELVPAVPPLPGITVSTSEGDINAVDVLGCIDDSESLPPVVGPGEEATGTVLVPDPVEGSYDVIYQPVTNIVSGGETEALAWTID